MARKPQYKPILVVSNRIDRRLQRHLAKSLVAKIQWVVGDKLRRVQSAAKSVEGGKYRMVILITGFLDHKASALLEASAKKSDTPVVRANRGRPAAVDRAVERDVGGAP